MASGGMDWFRWHHGSVTDPKFQLVARKVGCSVAEVIAVWACILEAASQSEERGCHGELDFESLDCALGLPDGRAEDIYLRMQDRSMVDGESVVAWHKRQPKREDDTANDRKRRQREREHELQMANIVTDNTSRNVTQCHDASRTVTLEERREEEGNTTSSLRSDVVPRARTAPATVSRPDDVSESVWQDFLAIRKANRAPLTGTALRGIEREAAKAALTLPEALEVCCELGWRGFNAGWYANRQQSASAPARRNQTPAARDSPWAEADRQRMAALAPGVARSAPTTVPQLIPAVEVHDVPAIACG